jgi:hypothetical protein
MPNPPDLPAVFTTIDTYLNAVAKHRTAEEMRATVLTEDFHVGFRGGYVWKGLDGLRKYLSQRDKVFDERLQLIQILSLVPLSGDDLEITTRLEFFFRRWTPPSPTSEEFSGAAFYTWTIRPVDEGMRVAEVIIDGFADLNDNARALFAVPDAGFDE